LYVAVGTASAEPSMAPVWRLRPEHRLQAGMQRLGGLLPPTSEGLAGDVTGL